MEDIYRTNDGGAQFRFNFVEESGGRWRADIQSMPSYGLRNRSAHSSHRLPSAAATTGRRICFAQEPRSLRDAQTFAETWSEATWEYIKTGRRTRGF